MDPTRKKKVVVIGAGIGGIATAARLAQCGVEVSVYEKNDFETYQHLGTSMPSEGIDLLKCDPNCNFWFDDGELFTTSTDLARMKRQLEKLDHQHGFGGFLAFLQESHQHYQQSVIHVLNKDFTGFLSLLRPAFLRYLFRLHPFHTVWQRASHFFPSHKLRQVFSLASMYLGMSPFEIPDCGIVGQYRQTSRCQLSSLEPSEEYYNFSQQAGSGCLI
ncbi:hypothetical protein PMG11_04357 [Penicillium brasilianum]|uniref:FAD/NAD(P)-binding domain-containing protein n=1 Tax=Penicillium brasilianum TaxID=104259 RepID=A0A0F7VHR5_PENBI|nr:hypothetical protein PMG11_04357 [Penicillium brasilianum]